MTGVDLEDAELRAELSAAYVSAASLVPDMTHEAPSRRRRLIDELADPPTDGQRAGLAHVALQAALLGEPRSDVSGLAERAWGDGALLESEPAAALGLPLLTGSLLLSDELERAVQICDAALDTPAATCRQLHSRRRVVAERGPCTSRGASPRRRQTARRGSTRSGTCSRTSGPHTERWPAAISSEGPWSRPNVRS